MKQQFAAKHPWTILAAGQPFRCLPAYRRRGAYFSSRSWRNTAFPSRGRAMPLRFSSPPLGWGVCLAAFYRIKRARAARRCGAQPCSAAAFLQRPSAGRAGWGFFLAFSIPAGLGTAFLYPSIQSCAQKWYAGRKGLATGVIGGAVGLTGAFLTVFVRTALRGFGPVQGIRGAFWALGAVTLPVCLVGSAYCRTPGRPKTRGASGENTLDLAPRQMLRTKQYWLCAGAVCFSTPAVLLFSPIILKLGMERGLEEKAALWSVVLGSVGSAAGRLLMPLLSDRIGRRPTDLLLFAVCPWAVGGVCLCAGLVGGGLLCGAYLLLLGAGGGAAVPFHRPVRLAPCGGELRLSGPGAERGQPCLSVCGQFLGTGSRAALAGHGRRGGGLCGHLGLAAGGTVCWAKYSICAPLRRVAYHGPAPIPEEGKWVKAKEISDISGFTHGVGWCAPQQGACKLTLNVKNGVIEEALVETIGCSGMTHSAAMASEILPGKTILEALNTDLVCDAINTAMRELFLQIVYGRTQTAFSEDGLPSALVWRTWARACAPGRHHVLHQGQGRPLPGDDRGLHHQAGAGQGTRSSAMSSSTWAR